MSALSRRLVYVFLYICTLVQKGHWAYICPHRQPKEGAAMAARVWALLNQKGGTTKTTSATNMAACLAVKHKKRVLLVDLDPQGSATDWAAARGDAEDDPGVIPIVTMGKALPRDLPRVASGYDYVIIDGVPQISELAAAAIKAATLVVIPVQPSPYDIWACGDLVQLVKDRQEIADGSPTAALLVSRAIPGTIMGREVDAALEELEVPVLKARTHQRQNYVKGVGQGLSVMDLPADDPARVEIEAVVAELLEMSE